MPTYHVQQTWRAKKAKMVLSHIMENPHKHPKHEFAEGCSKTNAILKLEHFLKSCVLCDHKEKKDDVI